MKTSIYFIFILGSFFTSCVEKADLKISTNRKLVVYGVLSPEDTATQFLVFYNKPLGTTVEYGIDPVIKDAQLLLKSNTQSFIIPYVPENDAFVLKQSDFKIVAGETYTLEVNDGKGLSVNATTTVPLTQPKNMDYYLDTTYTIQSENQKQLVVKMQWTNTLISSEINYFSYDIITKEEYNSDRSIINNQSKLADNINVADSIIQTINEPIYNSDYISIVNNINFGKLVMQVNTIDSNLYHYLKYAGSVNEEEFDLIQDPATVFTNINGGLGVFGSCRKSEEVITKVKWKKK